MYADKGEKMFNELFGAPLAYDLGVNATTFRTRKPSRKGKCGYRYKNIETIVMTSKEMSEIGAQALMKVFAMKGM